ncbi:hypothetical protein WJX79_005127 [Trebouxia sp. C0005]
MRGFRCLEEHTASIAKRKSTKTNCGDITAGFAKNERRTPQTAGPLASVTDLRQRERSNTGTEHEVLLQDASAASEESHPQPDAWESKILWITPSFSADPIDVEMHIRSDMTRVLQDLVTNPEANNIKSRTGPAQQRTSCYNKGFCNTASQCVQAVASGFVGSSKVAGQVSRTNTRAQRSCLDKLSSDSPTHFAFPMLWAMRTWPQVIADLGSANVSSTGFGERSHIMLKEAMEYTDRHGSKATIRQAIRHAARLDTAAALSPQEPQKGGAQSAATKLQRVLFILNSVTGDNTYQMGNVSLLRPPRGDERVFHFEQSRNEKKLPQLKAGPHARGDETFKRQLAAADASRLHTVVDNRLDVAPCMEAHSGNNMGRQGVACAQGHPGICQSRS